MKKIILLAFTTLIFVSCGKEKKEVKTKVATTKTVIKKVEEKAKTVTNDDIIQVTKGETLFTVKGCVACHQLDKKVIGPSLQNIAKTYVSKKGNMADFLKGKSDAIVDTDPSQIAIMKANITGVLKDMSTDDIHALTTYIRSAAK